MIPLSINYQIWNDKRYMWRLDEVDSIWLSWLNTFAYKVSQTIALVIWNHYNTKTFEYDPHQNAKPSIGTLEFNRLGAWNSFWPNSKQSESTSESKNHNMNKSISMFHHLVAPSLTNNENEIGKTGNGSSNRLTDPGPSHSDYQWLSDYDTLNSEVRLQFEIKSKLWRIWRLWRGSCLHRTQSHIAASHEYQHVQKMMPPMKPVVVV